MENNQYPIYIYVDDLQEQECFTSPQQYYQPEEKSPPQGENYPVMEATMSYTSAVPLVNQEIADLTQPLMVSISFLFLYFNFGKDPICSGLESTYFVLLGVVGEKTISNCALPFSVVNIIFYDVNKMLSVLILSLNN